MGQEKTLNTDVTAEEDVAAWIGLDWADREHHTCLYDAATRKVAAATIKHSAETLQEWVGDLQKRYQGAKVAVVLEQSRGAVIYALMNYDFLLLYPVNPASLASYRKTFSTSGAKNDPGDARLLMEMVRKHPEKFHQWKPEDPETRTVRMLVEERRKAVNEMTRLTNRLTSNLKNYYPEALEFAGELNTLQACEFLKRWPTLEVLQTTRPGQLRKFYQRYGRPRPEILDKRIELIKQAVPLTDDRAVVFAGSMATTALAALVRSLLESIEKYDDEIKRLFQSHPDCLVFESLPGAGVVLAPRLLAAFGADRDRWQSAAEVQTVSGIAPVMERSGRICKIHRRFACSKFIRQTFHEFAGSSTRWSVWAKAYYQDLRSRGKGHHSAVRSLAYKWIRVIFSCWKNRTPYNESLYLGALARRGSNLAKQVSIVLGPHPTANAAVENL